MTEEADRTDADEPIEAEACGRCSMSSVVGAVAKDQTPDGVVGATLVYALLLRRSRAPRRTFVRVAAAVLVLSFLPDLALLALDPAATVGGVVVLMLMHVVVAAASVGVLTRRVGLR